MGYAREKYTREYYLAETGNPGVGADGLEYYNRGIPHPRISSALDEVPLQGIEMLDIGFGRGEAIKYALEKGAKHVDGVDFSPAATTLARKYLMDWLLKEPHRVDLVCSDMLTFIRAGAWSYDLITMFDVIEHIPRREIGVILEWCHSTLNPAGHLIVTTPFYKVDNDVLAEGLNPQARDSSDNFSETQGMHCNRYTRVSLRSTLSAYGFSSVNDLLTIWRK